jgi:hypothetical protein
MELFIEQNNHHKHQLRHTHHSPTTVVTIVVSRSMRRMRQLKASAATNREKNRMNTNELKMMQSMIIRTNHHKHTCSKMNIKTQSHPHLTDIQSVHAVSEQIDGVAELGTRGAHILAIETLCV